MECERYAQTKVSISSLSLRFIFGLNNGCRVKVPFGRASPTTLEAVWSRFLPNGVK